MADTPNPTVIVTTEQGPEIGTELGRTGNEPESVLVEFADRTSSWWPADKVEVVPADEPWLRMMVAHVLTAIARDIVEQVVPATCSTFSELHDYVDANEYLIDALAASGREVVDDYEIEVAGAVATLVDHALPGTPS